MDYSTQFVLLILCSKCVAVNIKRIDVPALVEVGTESVVLDCEYSTGSVTPGPGLVMKWFFNGSAGLVYQWIPPMQPQVIGLLKGKVDMNFRISEEPLQTYRAIKILRPTTDLSGNYTCVVSTFMEEDRHTRPMLVYSPGKSFHFIQEKKYVFLVTLICFAEDLYPKPTMTILAKGKPLKQAVTEMKMDSWGLYTVETKVVVHDDDVTSPREEFVCTLSLPPANYTANRTTVYYPGLMPTAHVAAIEIEKPQERHANTVVAIEASFVCLQEVTHKLHIITFHGENIVKFKPPQEKSVQHVELGRADGVPNVTAAILDSRTITSYITFVLYSLLLFIK